MSNFAKNFARNPSSEMFVFIILCAASFLFRTEGRSTEAFNIRTFSTACSMGEFWNNSTGVCLKCRSCGLTEVLVKECSDTSDAICQCKSGWFTEDPAEDCRQCRQCPKGSQELSPCSPTSDTQCSECPAGTYRDDLSNACQTCSHCGPNELTVRTCSALSDTICISKDLISPGLERALRLKNHGRLRKDIPAGVSGEKQPIRSSASFWKINDIQTPEKALLYLPPVFVIIVAAVYCTFRIIQESDCPPGLFRRRSSAQQPLLPTTSPNRISTLATLNSPQQNSQNTPQLFVTTAPVRNSMLFYNDMMPRSSVLHLPNGFMGGFPSNGLLANQRNNNNVSLINDSIPQVFQQRNSVVL